MNIDRKQLVVPLGDKVRQPQERTDFLELDRLKRLQ